MREGEGGRKREEEGGREIRVGTNQLIDLLLLGLWVQGLQKYESGAV